jgi:hypothetical protein
MRRILFITVLVLLLVPVALADEPGGSSASAACKPLQKTAPAMFGPGKTYRNLGACVSTKSHQANQNATNAAKTCKAEQTDPNFAGGHGGKSFSDFYGTNANANGNGSAFGKCVSSKAKTKTDGQDSTELNAANQCKAQRADTSFAGNHGGKSFNDFYGTNANKKNAFGKCVSTLAKAKTK